jgi:uncharacterized repeat protein (TIGR03803 family)
MYQVTISPPISILTGGINTLAVFTGSNGFDVLPGLVEDSNGNFFGVTQEGGTSNVGTLFELHQGTVTTLVSFDVANGSNPETGLIQDSSGNLFGTTYGGGTFGSGTIFELPHGSSTIITLVSFSATTGQNPRFGVTLDSNGDLFGTTSLGGTHGTGTVFELPHGANALTILADFGLSFPTFKNVFGYVYDNLVVDSSGNLFGTTNLGGADNDGTVFEVQKGSGTVTTLVAFDGSNGANPENGVVRDNSGNLFGTTHFGGVSNQGTIFELPYDSSTGSFGQLITLASLDASSGGPVYPIGSLIEDSSGEIFGTTGGLLTVFELHKSTELYNTVANFNNYGGPYAYTSLLSDSSGNLFGSTFQGGYYGDGTVFEITHVLSNATVGALYNQQITTFGGTGNLTFTDPGTTLPPGLTLSGTGFLSGTPTTAGNYVIKVTVTDSVGATASQTYTLTVSPSVSILTTSLPVGNAGMAYDPAITGSGGSGSLSFAITAGSLPGVTLSANGSFQGTPTTSGSFQFTVSAADSVGDSASQTYTVNINPPLTITPSSLANWPVNQPGYLQTITASGGTASYTFSETGSLPTGLSLSSAGVLAGTPTVAGRFSFTVTVTDSASRVGSQSYQVTINPPISILTGGITTLAVFNNSNGINVLPGLVEDSSGNLFGVTQLGGTFNVGTLFELHQGILTTLVSFDNADGTYPETGLIQDSNGNIFGTTYLGGANGDGTIFELSQGSSIISTLVSFDISTGVRPRFGVTRDSNGDLFGTTSLGGANGTGTVFELPHGANALTVLANFDSTFPTTYLSGVVDDNLVVDSNGNLFGTTNVGGANNDGTVYEVPKGSGTVATLFSFDGTHGANPENGLVQDRSGNLFGTTHFGGIFGVGTTFEIPYDNSTGNYGPLTTLTSLGLSSSGPAYPIGSLIEDSSGEIFGTTGGVLTVFELHKSSELYNTVANFNNYGGPYAYTSLLSDSSGNLFGSTFQGGYYGNGTIFEITHVLSNATVGAIYNQEITTFGGTGKLTFTDPGTTLPPGLTLSSDGFLSGTPTASGNDPIKITVTDSTGATASQTYTLTVNPPVTILTTSLPGGDVGTVYGPTVAYSGGSGYLSFAVTAGTLPDGVTLSSVGSFQGAPTTPGLFPFTVTAADSVGSTASQSYKILINNTLSIGMPGPVLPQGTAGVAYSQTYLGSGGTGTYTFSASASSLPPGLRLSSAGMLAGIPTTAGTYTFTVTVTDQVGGKASESYTVSINPAVTIATSSLANWTVNQLGYSQTISASGGTGGLTFFETGPLPAGLTLTSAGMLSGTPTTAGNFTFTVTAVDTLGGRGNQTYFLTINSAVAITTVVLSNWPLNQPGYNQTIATTGGTAPFTFKSTGTLPTGLSLGTTGILSGTPTSSGTFTFTVTATDSTEASASRSYTIIVGLWTPLTNTAPAAIGTMLLLTDGTVIAQGAGISSAWYKLTPDSSGSYVNGTWSQLASMSTPREYGGSMVLPNGDVLFVGGEYSGSSLTANENNTGEIYDPIANTWSAIAPFPQSQFGDGMLELLANGDVLAGYLNGPETYLYDPATNTWSTAGTKLHDDQSDEENWVKLPDGSILTYDIWSGNATGNPTAQRYLPTSNTWVDAGSVPLPLSVSSFGSQSAFDELGPAVLLPNGNVFQIGANGATGNAALYAPSTNTWVAGPTIPGGLAADDAPAAVLPNGDVIFAADIPPYTAPTELFSYDPTANTITPLSLPNALANQLDKDPAFSGRMLVLPTGEILLSDSSGQLWDYNPSATPTTSWRPTISSVTYDGVSAGQQTYTLKGTQLSGLDEGAYFGDDAQMASNYPIIQLTQGNTVYTARTFNWISQVATGSTPVTTQFALPAGLPGGTYALTVVANGISSTAIPFTFLSISPGGLSATTVGSPYSQTFTASGGTGSHTFTTTGALPAGLTLSTAGVLSGIPTTTGTFSFTVTASDAAGDSNSQTYILTVNPAVTIATTTLAAWTVNQTGYSQTIQATGGTGALLLSATGALPSGLTFTQAGVLSGMPTSAGSFSVIVQAIDTVGAASSHSYTITINPPLTIPSTLVNWTINQPGYDQTLRASGGTGTSTLSLTAGALPPGLMLMPLAGTAVLSGTPTATGSFSFTLTATDSVGATGTHNYTVTVNLPGTIGITTIASFDSLHGAEPLAGLLADSSCNLFSTTQHGGTYDDGTVFEVQPGSGMITILSNFSGGVGGYDPEGGLVEDAGGDLFGTTKQGGTMDAGTVFEIPWKASASSYGSLMTLASFTTNGAWPMGALAVDHSGDLFGATNQGGASNVGTVFELPYSSSSGSYGTLTTLATFNGVNGASPVGGLTIDSSGNLLGTTKSGGSFNSGTVFELPYSSSTGSYGTLLTLATFNFANGANPSCALTEDSAGNLFGTTAYGGVTEFGPGYGTVFELPYNRSSLTYGPPTTLATFTSGNGANPEAGLLLDSSGDLLGTTENGGAFGYGTVFEIKVGSSAVSILGTFNILNGANPTARLTLSKGRLYGTVTGGGAGYGTVFEVITTLPSGTAGESAYSQTLGGSGGTGGLTFSAAPASLPPGLTLSSMGVLTGIPTTAGVYSFLVTATDATGVSDSHIYTVTINPAVTIASVNPPNGKLGQAYDETIEATGGTGILTFNLTTGILPTGLSLSSAGVLSGTPTAAGHFMFTVSAIDSVGAFASNIYTVIVFAIDPGALPNWTVDLAGYSATFSASGGIAPYIFRETWPLPTGLNLSSTGVLSGEPTVAGSYAFLVTATDATGSSDSILYNVTINPAVTITTATLPNWGVLDSGYSQTIHAIGGTGSTTFTSIGTLPTGMMLSKAGVLAGIPTATGTFIFGVIATDALGATGTQIYTVVIDTQHHPTVPGDQDPDPGTAYAPYSPEPVRGIGGYQSYTAEGNLPPGITLSPDGVLSGTPTTPGTYTFVVSGVDDMGVSHVINTYMMTINPNPNPFTQYLVEVVGPSIVRAGSALLLLVQEADQYGNPVTTSGAPTVTASISPSVPGFPATVSIDSSGVGSFLATLSTVGTYTISVSGTFVGSANPVTVIPGPPTHLSFLSQPTDTPTGVALPAVSVEVQDSYGNMVTSDSSDTVTLGVASGPGAFLAESTISAPVVDGVATFNNLVLVKPGTYQLSAIVTGLYTGPSSASFSVAPLQVQSFAGSPSGFSLQFNAPYLVNSVTPVLYGAGYGINAPVPSVTLTQIQDASGNPVNTPVEGSVILNTAVNGLNFLATNTSYEANNGSPILPDGTYVADLTSSATTNGFQALNSGGGFLDGLLSGHAGSGDYIATFTVTAAADKDDVLWIPATADGPGQPLNAPGNNRAGGGYPVYLDDGTGMVTSVQLTLTYDPTLLNVAGVTGTYFSGVAKFSTPGHEVLQYHGPALPAGNGIPIGYILATVPVGTTTDPVSYKAKDLLHLSNVSLTSTNGGTVPIVTSDALHLVAYVGDADGNGSYSSNDAVLITRAALQIDSGFTAYPLVDPAIVADTDGSGFIPADAALQANEAGVNFPAPNLPSPPIPAGVYFRAIANNVDPTLSIPGNLLTGADGIVTVPVNVDDPHPEGSTGLVEGHVALTYDPRQFTISAADVHLGSVLAVGSSWSVTPTIDQATGELAIAFSSDTPIIGTAGGSLLTIDFHAVGGLANPSTIALVSSASPNGQYVTTELEDAQGTFTLSPAPTNDFFDPRIDGLVQLTAAPAAAAIATPGMEAAIAVPDPVVQRLALDDHPLVDALPAEEGVPASPEPPDTRQANSPSVTAELLDRPFVLSPVAMAAAMHANAAAQAAAMASAAFTTLSTPITGLVFPYSGVIVVNAQTSAGQFIPSESVVRKVSDAVDHVLAGPPMVLQPTANELNGLNWDEIVRDLDSRANGDLMALPGRRNWRELTGKQTVSLPVAVDHTAVDRCFTQAGDDSNLIMDEE